MTNRLYPLGRQAFGNAEISWIADTIKVIGVSIGYTPNFATDEFLSVIPGGAIIAAAQTLASKTNVNGVMNAANIVFPAVSGSQIVAYVVYKDTGVAGTSHLIAWIDTATGLPVNPNGSNINLAWDTNPATLIFAL